MELGLTDGVNSTSKVYKVCKLFSKTYFVVHTRLHNVSVYKCVRHVKTSSLHYIPRCGIHKHKYIQVNTAPSKHGLKLE